MPKYDFRCDSCGHQFELTRSYGQSSEPADCPRDGTGATRLFSPPLDLLVYSREPVVSAGRVTIPPGALSCHDHGPPPGSAALPEHESERSGSRWHARGYEDSGYEDSGAVSEGQSHGYGHAHAHAHGHAHTHGHGPGQHHH